MNIFQILITDKEYEQEPLPNALVSATQTVKGAFSDYKYQFFNHTAARLFIEIHFNQAVLDAFDGIRPYAYKSDLARYCLLYERGGWYVDIGLKMLSSISANQQIELIAFADRGCPSCAPWAVQNGLIYTKPRNSIMAKAIEEICNNYRNRFYGQSPLDPTGPNLLGRLIASHSNVENSIFGEFRPLTPDLSFPNLMYVTQSGYLVAQHRTSWMPGTEGGDFEKLGGNGTNNYKKLWNERLIYE